MTKKMSLNYTTSITNIKSFDKNSSFDYGTLKVAYTGLNRNNSFISKEAFQLAMASFDNVPVVTNYIKDKEDINGGSGDFGGHDMHIEIDEDKEGNLSMDMVYDTHPVGVVPESANKWFEVFEEDGEIREYVCCDVLLWKRQPAYKKIKEMGRISHSMEIDVLDGGFDSDQGFFNIKNFELNALTLLGTDVEPCFEGSALTMFNKDSFKAQYQLMMSELKQYINSDEGGESVEEINEVTETVEVEVIEETTAVVEDTEIVEEVVETEEVKEEVVEDFEVIKSEFEATIEELRAEIEVYKAEKDTLTQEITELREFKSVKLAEERKANEEGLFAKYSALIGVDEFDALKDNASKFETIEELEKEIALIYAKHMLNKEVSKKFSKTQETITIPVIEHHEVKKNDGYGGLFDKYLNKKEV